MRSNESQAPTNAPFRRLRWRLTALIAGLVAVVVVILIVFIVAADRRLRDEQLATSLLRAAETVSQAMGFAEGELVVADDGVDVPGSAVVLASRTPLTADELPGLAGYVRDFGELPRRQLALRLAEVVNSLPARQRTDLQADYDAADRRALIDAVIADPPVELVREAQRRYVFERARSDGVALAETEIVGTSRGLDVVESEVLEVLDGTISSGLPETIVVDWAPDHLLRTVPLRDGVVVRGAGLVAVDRRPVDDAHGALRSRLIVAGAITVVAATLAAWWVAGRAIRPARAAVARQERFLADAAHELRTPIAAIRATAERGAGVNGDPNSALGRITELAGAAGDLTDDLLTLARMDAGALAVECEPVRLDLLIEAVLEDGESIQLDMDEVTVEADPRLLERVVANLAQNAVRHGHASPQQPATITVRGGVLEISDRGPGIAPTVAGAMFDRFASGPGSSGHGLGLALVGWIIEQHGWTIEVSETPGGGATFAVDFGA